MSARKFDRAAWEARKREARHLGTAAGIALTKTGAKVDCPYKEGSSLYCIFHSGVLSGALQSHAGRELLGNLRQLSDNLWAAWKKKKGIKDGE
jgi:hypothetical protein